ncbi:MAG: carbohydrate binding family 9 domain-containing protein [Fimbriimonadales bacterium]|nr:carbohydrate binding family 9 domain-containing protein [Fimbriimonadales bacterium]
MRPWVCAWIASAGLWSASFGQPVEPRSFPAHKLSRPPILDGVVNAEEWTQAYCVERFWSPSRQQWGAFPTRAYIGYNAEAIYVAFVCEDPDPSQIRARETKRGGNLENDDTVLVLIEPQARGLEPYTFTVNARGAQSDEFPAGTTENIRWRGDWQAATQILPNGWSAELRIPFRILRYPPKQDRFGVILERYIPRLNEIYTFPNMGAYYSTQRQSLWTGLELPPPRYPIILLPYFTGDSDPQDTRARSGLDIRYIAGDPLTALLTLKPDFRNIAADVANVDFSYTEKLLAETRPFFQEGSEFMPPRTAFYSLRVQDLNAGLKAFGTLGDWRYGGMLGEYLQNGRLRQYGVGRVRYQFAERSFIDLLGVRLRGDVCEETLGALLDTRRITGDGELRLTAAYHKLNGDRDGAYQQYALRRNARERLPNYLVEYTDIEPNYRPRLGFAPETGYRGLRLGALWFDRPQSERLLYTETQIVLTRRTRYGGTRLDEGVSLLQQWLFRSQHRLTGVVEYLNRPPNIDRTVGIEYAWNVIDLYRTGSLYVRAGEQNGGRSWYVQLAQAYELAPRFRVKLDMESLEIDYPDAPTDRARQLVFTLNYEIDSERALGGRLILNRLEFGGETETTRNFYLTYLQRVRRGFDVYVIYGLPNATRSQNRLAIKLITPLEL